MKTNIKFSNHLFKTIAVWAFMLSIIVSLIIGSFSTFFYTTFKNNLEERTKQNITNMNFILMRFYEIGTSLSYDPNLIEIIQNESHTNNDIQKELTTYLTKNILSPGYMYSSSFAYTFIIRDYFEVAEIFENNDSTLCKNNILSSKNFSDVDWYNQTLKNPLKNIIIDSPSNNEIIVSSAIYSQNYLLGVLVFNIPLSNFLLSADTINSNSNSNITFLVNINNKNFIIGNDFKNEFFINFNIFSNQLDFNIENQKLISQKVQNIKYLTYLQPINNDYNILAICRENEVFKPIYLLTVFIIISIVGLIIFSFINAKRISNKLSKPISELVNEINNFNQTNDFNLLINKVENISSNCVEIVSVKSSICTFSEQILELIHKINEKNSEIKNSEIKALQAQINPHFMYNTLDAISWKCMQYDHNICDTISNLSDFLRYSIKSPDKLVKLNDEVNIISKYINIIQYAQQKKINFNTIGDKNLLTIICLPKITLQPIVENCILHGLKNADQLTKKELNITITVDIIDDNTCIKIADNGISPDIDKMYKMINSTTEINHYGIKNVHNRLQNYFGQNSGLTFEKNEFDGCTVIITLPFIGG